MPKFCQNCGSELVPNTKFCERCGAEVPKEKKQVHTHHTVSHQKPMVNRPPLAYQPPPPYQQHSPNQPPPPYQPAPGDVSPKSKTVLLIIWLFLGVIGGHYFYAERIGMGLIYFFTGGFFFIGFCIDIFAIASGTFKDVNGLPIAAD